MNLPLIDRAQFYANNTAIATPERRFTYQELLDYSAIIAQILLENVADLQEQAIAFLIPAGFDYVAVQWGIWRAGAMAVPLCISHPRPELEYVITHSEASILIAHPDFQDRLAAIATTHNLRFIITNEISQKFTDRTTIILPEISGDRRALMLYTSGTTGKPKGVVITHANIQAQVTSLVTAWEWRSTDYILHVLPLHHIHGIINILTCALWSGATCYLLPKFDPEKVWQLIETENFTLFMAVPTIYVKLIDFWKKVDLNQQQILSQCCQKMRLMVSGSAALPVQVLEEWQQISQHFLLERYGMTEIGMALSNPLNGDRRAGSVGQPLPGVQVRLVDDNNQPVSDGIPGEIQVKSPNVFREYWHNPEATEKAFKEGWFCTGDTAIIENGYYRILGRNSVDIIKTGGYKVSALEIEEVIRTHPNIRECAVVAIGDREWGEQVCAALVLKTINETLTLENFRNWAKERLAIYKVPRQILILEVLPHNALGKVTKPAIIEQFKTHQISEKKI